MFTKHEHNLLTDNGYELFKDFRNGTYEYMKKEERLLIKMIVRDKSNPNNYAFAELESIKVTIIDVHKGKLDEHSFSGVASDMMDKVYKYIGFFIE
jgi:hypothetical protein